MEQIVYFNPGDIVTLKQDISGKPKMIVVRKEVMVFPKRGEKEEKKSTLIGIKCRWFTTEGQLLEAIWSTKDLVLLEASTIKE